MNTYRPRPVAPGSQSPRAGMQKNKKRVEMLRQGAGSAMSLAARSRAAGRTSERVRD